MRGEPLSSDLVLYTREEPGDSEPLTVSPIAVVDDPAIPDYFSSDWVAQKVIDFLPRCGAVV